MPVVESASSLLRQARQQADLTQTQLAERAGTTQSVISAYESGRRQPSVPVLLRLIAATGHSIDASLVAAVPAAPIALGGELGRRVHGLRDAITTIAASYGAGNVRVFGSVARGAEQPDSDIDLLVELPPGTGMFALGRLRRELEDLLGARVDVVPANGLKPDVYAHIEPELIAL